MLTFLSRSIRQLLYGTGRNAPAPADAPHLRALPNHHDLQRNQPSTPSARRAVLRLARACEEHDMRVAPPAAPQVGATAFVAGQGARIYSLDAFRPRRGPHHPQAA
jgi:hypothetical protein